MPEDPNRPANAEEAFAIFTIECEKALATGRSPPRIENWIARYPDFADELRRLDSDWRGFDELLRDALSRPQSSVFHRPRDPEHEVHSWLPLGPGDRVGDFRLIERIGRGGMGEVWAAEQLSLARRVALKFIRPDKRTARATALFEREARAGGRLEHPGLVSVHATGREGELHWIAQELVEGAATLHEFVDSARVAGELPRRYFEQVAGFVAELCDALQVAHEHGVVHRDVKPHNVLVTKDDRPKLTDFGLARLSDEEPLSGSYGVKGTPIYMSPEQLLGKTKLIDHRTDVYSTGAVLYELLTFHRPFEVDSSRPLLRSVTEDPADPRELKREIPVDLAAIAMRALERRPADRYRTAQAMADDLRAFVEHRPVHARPVGVLGRWRRWARRRPALATAAALALLLVGATWFFRGRVAHTAERLESIEKELLLSRAWRAIDAGDLEGMERHLAEFALDHPGDPRGAQVLAAGYSRSLRVSQMEDALAGLGEVDSESALGLYARALRTIAEEKSAGNESALQDLERAYELDPALEVALYPMFQLRKSLGRTAAAREALVAYRGTLRTSDPSVELVDALLEELEGDRAAGYQRLVELRSTIGDAAFSELRGFRALGRMALELFNADPAVHADRLGDAVEALEVAVADVPRDFSSWNNLGLASIYLHERERGTGIRVQRAKDAAVRALELDPASLEARRVLVVAEHHLMQLAPGPKERQAALEAIEEAVGLLDPADPTSRSVRSDLLFEDGRDALARGDLDEALDAFSASAELSELQYRARVLKAQLEVEREDFEAARGSLLAAERACLRQHEAGLPDWGWLFAIRVWLFGVADRLGDLERALLQGDLVRDLLDQGHGTQVDAFNLAEFLSTPLNAELRDCALALRLVEDFGIEQGFGADHPMLLAIRAACAE